MNPMFTMTGVAKVVFDEIIEEAINPMERMGESGPAN